MVNLGRWMGRYRPILPQAANRKVRKENVSPSGLITQVVNLGITNADIDIFLIGLATGLGDLADLTVRASSKMREISQRDLLESNE